MSLGTFWLALLVPPVNLLLLCLVGWAIGRRRRVGAALLAVGLCGLLVLSLPVVSTHLIYTLERDLPRQGDSGAEAPGAIVILSGDVSRDNGRPQVGSLTLERERAGAALERQTGLPILVTGGSIDDTGTSLAGMMADSLASDFRVPVRWVETKARDTRENATLSAAILKQNGIRSVYVVTHAWHMRRALLDFADTGLTVASAPVRRDTLPVMSFGDFVPRASSWRDSYYALHEWIGMLVQPYRPD